MPRRPDKNKIKIHKTSLNIPYDIFIELKLNAIDRGMYLSELMNELIEDYLKVNRK